VNDKRQNLMMILLPTLPEFMFNVPLIVFIMVNPYHVMDSMMELTQNNAFYGALLNIAWLPFCLPYYFGVRKRLCKYQEDTWDQ